MVSNVIKRDGQKEPFDAQKIKNSIQAAAKEAGIEEANIQSLVEQIYGSVLSKLEGVDEVPSNQIKELVLSELDSAMPSVSEAWRKHEQTKG